MIIKKKEEEEEGYEGLDGIGLWNRLETNNKGNCIFYMW